MYENNPQEPQPLYGGHPLGYQPAQQEPYQGFHAPQQPQFDHQQGWEQQPRRGRPPGPPRGRKQRSGGHRVRNVVLGLLGVIILIIIIATATSNGGGSNTPCTKNGSPVACPSAAAPAAAVPAASDASANPSVSPSPAAPQYTASQQAAIQDASSYLSTEPGFSMEGLIGQLEFDKFSAADATFAVNHITVDWDQQAADDAKNYQTTEGGFSCGSMVQQLEFDKFTPEQAAYGASSVGLGSC